MKIYDDITNYYEDLVIQHFTQLGIDEKYDDDYVADLTCIVLNQLPTRYIRHQVDMVFYLPDSELIEMKTKVKSATKKSLEFMENNQKANA